MTTRAKNAYGSVSPASEIDEGHEASEIVRPFENQASDTEKKPNSVELGCKEIIWCHGGNP